MKMGVGTVGDIVNEAIELVGNTMFGKYLLERFPVRMTSEKVYPDVNATLKKYGSPACTDGKDVYVEPEILGEMLEKEYHHLNGLGECPKQLDDYWKRTINKESPYKLCYSEMVSETRDVLLHELTHAFNEHTKLRIAARNKNDEYKMKLDIACELQANDGICGRCYMDSALQQNEGVCNKRLHQETIGKHTLKGLMDAVKLNAEEQMQLSMARLQAALREEVAKKTGEYEKQLQQVQEQEDGKEDDERIEGGAMAKPEEDDETTDDKIAEELQKRGIQQIKELILASLSDELRYDASTDSVIFDRVVKRHRHKTYSRPSKTMRDTGESFMLVKKGIKHKKEYEYNKSRKVTVLAVDGSGSMRGQQKYVALILDDLLKQVEAVANEYDVEVHYENLQATVHRTRCERFVPASSDEWHNRMGAYRASGGNDFDCVLRATNGLLSGGEAYDAITIINLSDGLDVLDDTSIMDKTIGDYIKRGKAKWVDALVVESAYSASRANEARLEDSVKIREQVLITKPLN